MRSYQSFLLSTVSVGIAVLLASCGGGGGGTATVTPTTLSGVAASGAAFEGAVITVTDKIGAVVGTSSAVGADGKFTITLSATAQAPFVLSASRTNADGQTETLVSVVPTASNTATTVNISPVTQLIAARLSASGDPSKLAAELAAGTATVSAATVAAKVSEVKTILAPLLAATGNTDADPLTSTFAADGTGYDRMLDSLQVTIVPASATASNIEIGIKQQQLNDGAGPTVISFASSDPVANVPTMPAIAASSLLPSGTATKINDFLAQLTACYALPTTTRVDSTVTGGLATGAAINVFAPACRTAFLGDDPRNFSSNGNTVGRDSNGNGAFASLFKDSATGSVFSQGHYEFSRNNGDIVVGYKVRDSGSNESYDTFVLRADTDAKLKLIGNQYNYAGGVVAYQQLREFVNAPAQSYYSTGYDLRVPLISGVSYVEVVSPKGDRITLIPGSDSMVLPKRDALSTLTASGTTFVRLRSEYAKSTGAPTSHPSGLDTSLFFAATDYTDSQMTSIPNQGVWTFNYYSGAYTRSGMNATGGNFLVAQYYKTRTRANSIAELRTQTWASLTSTLVDDMKTRSASHTTLGSPLLTFADLPQSNNMPAAWEVPAGALPPTQVKLFGNGLYYDYTNNTTKSGQNGFTSTTNTFSYSSVRTPFNDGQNVGSTARATTIACADGAIDVNNMGEKHCANPGPGYLSTAHQTGLHLWARDPSGREYAHFYAPYTLQ